MAWPVLKAVKKPKKKEDILFCDHEAFFVKNPYCLLMQVSEKNRALFLLLYTNKKKLEQNFTVLSALYRKLLSNSHYRT